MRFARTFLLVALLALVAVPAAFAIRFTDDSYFMPTGTVGQPYTKTFGGAGGCGPALPYQYTVISGALPPGLSLSFSGTISGTPTAAGSFSFYVNLSDQNPPSADWCRPAEAQREFTIVVDGAAAPVVPLSINQPALTPKLTTLGSSYSVQLSASGGGTQTWALSGGSLPSGLQLSSSGLISGAPTATGDFTFTVRVTDGSRSATQTYSLSVVQPLKIAPVSVPAGEVAVPFALSPSAAGGRAGYTWSAANLPVGVSLDAATGRVSGTPSTPGSFPVKLTVTDSVGLTDTVDVTLTFAPKLSIVTRTPRAAKLGRALALRLTATGGVEPRTWKIVRGSLPKGVRFSARTGAFSGTPRHAGKAKLVVQVSDKLGGTARLALTLTVKA
jgi:large repetitive protein